MMWRLAMPCRIPGSIPSSQTPSGIPTDGLTESHHGNPACGAATLRVSICSLASLGLLNHAVSLFERETVLLLKQGALQLCESRHVLSLASTIYSAAHSASIRNSRRVYGPFTSSAGISL